MNLLEIKKIASQKINEAYKYRQEKTIINIEIIDLFKHIKYLKGGPICFFKEKSGDTQMLAHGAYEIFTDLNQVNFEYSDFIFGGEKFPANLKNENNGYYFKPIIIYRKNSSNYNVNLEININYNLIQTKKDLSKFILHVSDLLEFKNEFNSILPKKKHIVETPEIDDWKNKIEKVTKLLNDEQKIVLSRKKIISFENNVHESAIIDQIPNLDNQYLFFLKQTNDQYFISVSPERLFSRKNDDIIIDCIAGTRPRGRSIQEDKNLEKDLINSKKERSEHLFVANFIEKEMNKICDELLMTKAFDILKLQKVQHLHSEFRGKLKNEISYKTILEQIYPTPAVAGTPSKYAIEHIAELESAHREFYAGACGYLSKSSAELLVAIRSIDVKFNEIHIFGGAGIIADSNYQNEWNETEQKMKNFSFLWEH